MLARIARSRKIIKLTGNSKFYAYENSKGIVLCLREKQEFYANGNSKRSMFTRIASFMLTRIARVLLLRQ